MGASVSPRQLVVQVTVCSQKLRIYHCQGSVLSSLLFIIVVNVFTEDVRDAFLMELLYTDDLTLFCG